MQVSTERRIASGAIVSPQWVRESPRANLRALRGFYVERGKRLFSIVSVIITAPAWIPLLLSLILLNAIYLRSLRGAVFSQDRIGRFGKRFRMHKLRTLRDGFEPTRLGSMLRRTHLDELPQLWNILRGDMCLVGARPETVAIEAWANRGIPGFSKRLQLRPGLTGLAQIVQGHVGPDLEGYREKLRLNEKYLSKVSFIGDLGILLRTVSRVICAKGA